MSSAPSKIVLNTTSKVSLHDRFSSMSKSKPAAAPAQQASRGQATAKSRKLALQMADRPSVKAALGGKGVKRPGLNQRLGKGIDSSRIGLAKRLTLARKGPAMQQRPVSAQRGGFKPKGQPSNKPVAISRVGPRGGIGLKNRIKFLKTNNLKKKMQTPTIKASMVKKNQMKKGVPKQQQAGNKKGKQQEQKAQNKKPEPKNKESLDMDLDKYMAKTKSSLDNDLDTYMAQQN